MVLAGANSEVAAAGRIDREVRARKEVGEETEGFEIEEAPGVPDCDSCDSAG